MKITSIAVFILLLFNTICYSQTPVQVSQPYNFLKWIQSPTVKIGATDTATTKKALRDTAAAIRADIQNITLTDNILKADNTLKTFKPHTSRPTGIGFYTGSDIPTGSDPVFLNGYFGATGIYADVDADGSYYYIEANGLGLQKYNYGIFDASAGRIQMKYEVNEYTQVIGNTNIGANLLFLDFSPYTQVGSTNNISGSIIQVTDEPKTIGTKNHAIFISLTETSPTVFTERIKLSPRAKTSDSTAYLFDTDRVLDNGDTLFIIKNNGVKKLHIDANGYMHGDCPHAKSMFMDSSITINLSQNTWYHITNQTSKSTWPSSMFTGFTDNSDTITASYTGHYRLFYQINTSGVNNNIYEYRIMKKSGATTSEVWRYQVTGTGTRVLRIIETSIALTVGDKYWAELRSTSVAPGSITLYGGQMTIEPIHLDL